MAHHTGACCTSQDCSQNNIALCWIDLSVTVKIPGKKACCGQSTPPTERVILKNVTGHAGPGCLLAIMGASGSGKSTLLNVLTSRNTKDYLISGEVRLNGVPIIGGMREISAYVQQHDLFIHTLTVREQLQLRAFLRMDKHLNKKARLKRVEEVIVEMGLSGCADSRIGAPSGSLKGISGGERKRLSFASEALTNPPVFFCDEPTSSLDTFMAQSIVQTLLKMASRGTAILCTIHQPSSELFALFNQVLLLAQGRVAYMGSSYGALEFFSGLEYPCPMNFNPADHYILVLAIVPGEEKKCIQKTDAICDAFAKSQHAHIIASDISDVAKRNELREHITSMIEAGASRYASSLGVKLKYLFWRSWTTQFRDPLLFQVRVAQNIAIALILGLAFLRLDVDQKSVKNITGAIFLLTINICLTNLYSVLTSFPGEMHIVMREYGSGLYAMTPYFITKTVAEFFTLSMVHEDLQNHDSLVLYPRLEVLFILQEYNVVSRHLRPEDCNVQCSPKIPLVVILTVVFSGCTYWIIGLRDDLEAFAILTLVLVIASLISVAVGYIISIISGDTTVALALSTPVMMPFLLFGGMFLNGDDIPEYFLWLGAISWFKYAFEITMVNQWDKIDKIECVRAKESGVANVSFEQLCKAQTCLYNTGKDVLTYNSLDKDDLKLDYYVLGALLVAGYLIAFIALLIRARSSSD